tara:strand:+ start:60 stop:551 length:492 start_codon:yes stop_codon:yes gene_type:complete
MKKVNVLLSTFFGCGYLTKIPGTLTSIVTVIIIYIAYEILEYTNFEYAIIFFSLFLFYSFYAVKDIEAEFKKKDPKEIVIDEVLGQSMPLIFLLYLSQNNQLTISIEIYCVLSLIFFRFFDILKPFPVSYFDKNYKNYFGIIMDDIIAGLYSILCIYLVSLKF